MADLLSLVTLHLVLLTPAKNPRQSRGLLGLLRLSIYSSRSTTQGRHGNLGTTGPRHFWIFGAPPRNTMHRSKNHFFCHTSFLGKPRKPGDFDNRPFQIGSNSRLMPQ